MYIVIDYFPSNHYYIVCDEEGNTKYFTTWKGAKDEADSCQDAFVLDLDSFKEISIVD